MTVIDEAPTSSLSSAFTPPATPPALVPGLLALAAEVVDDLERVRVGNENRLRQLTRVGPDEDGEHRGFGLSLDHPDVARMAALVTNLKTSEEIAVKNLESLFRQHPLHAWARSQRGVGDKQAARLLAIIGDPFIRPDLVRTDGSVDPSRPRSVSELWAYCGYHVMSADGYDPSDPSSPGVAPYRKRGVKANWSSPAKMRVWNISATCVKQLAKPCYREEWIDEAGKTVKAVFATHVSASAESDGCRCGKYRRLFDDGRRRYEHAVHAVECPRCGPAGHPAQPGSPLSAQHQMARAMRLVSKEILKDMWLASRERHEAAVEFPNSAATG